LPLEFDPPMKTTSINRNYINPRTELLLAVIFLLLLNVMAAHSQTGNLEWAKTFTKTGTLASGSAAPIDLKIDNAGNVVTTGILTDTYDFDPGAGTFNLRQAGKVEKLKNKMVCESQRADHPM